MDGVLSGAFVAAMARLAQLPDHRCSEPWEWSGHSGWPLQVRDALYRSLEEELGAVAAQSAPGSEAARLLAVGQRAWGELRGLILGLPDALLDQEPPAGSPGAGKPPEEWTLRRVLSHVLLTERRYREQVEYALQRSDDEPLRREPMARVSPGEEEGGLRRWVERLAAERRAGAVLGGAGAEQLLRPTVWAGYEVDVRFRMLRFAGHLVEHTVQAEKLLAVCGHRIGESHMIVRRISAARGAHELSTPIDVLARLDGVHAEREASLASST
jgi:DinB family protein